jgi:predicted ABC-type sugar transport system permease subunit
MDVLERFLNQMAARLTGPLNFRFILQLVVAILLGIRDGKLDAKAGQPPFILDVLLHSEVRGARLRRAVASATKAVIVGIIIDALVQYLMFKAIYPVQAILVGTLVIAVPYAAARGLTNRLTVMRRGRGEPGHIGPA